MSGPGVERPAKDEPVRYGVIGTGMMGCEHILNLTALGASEGSTTVVAISDPNPTSRDWGVACAGGDEASVAVYEHHRDLLARDDLDAVVVATPNVTHATVLDDVFATPLAVMVEKPMCTTVEDALAVRDRARDREAMCWVALEYRFMPTVAAFASAVDEGLLGRLRMVSIREHRFPFLAKVGDWNRFNANTGGTLVEKCCHFFDLMNLVVGARPTRVYASGGQDVNHLNESYELADGTVAVPDILDNAFVIVVFVDGSRGALDLCMFAEGGRFEQELVAVGDRAKVEATVPGDAVWVGPRDGGERSTIEAPLDPSVTYAGFHHGSSFREHQEFVRCLRAGLPPVVGVDDGLWSVAVGVAAHRSIDEGRPVTLDELGVRD